MLARALLIASVLQALLIYLPMPVWALWKLHFAALESCFLGALTGAGAWALGRTSARTLKALAGISIIACIFPAISAAPAYLREGQRFSLIAWLSGGASAAVIVQRDIELAPGLVADVYRAPGLGPHPFVLVVHGGSWRSGDKGDAPDVSRAIAAQGATVFDVRYRLAPAHRFPAAVQDVKCMLGRVRARSAEFAIDPARGALLGRSAGGQIALIAAYSDSSIAPSCAVERASTPLRAVVSIYGPTDLAWGYDNPYWPDVVNGTNALEQYLGGSPRAMPETYRRATPQSWVSDLQSAPATLLIHGTAEHCVRPDNAERLRSALTAHNRSVRMLLVPMADHGFDIRSGGLGEQLARGVLLDFFREKLR